MTPTDPFVTKATNDSAGETGRRRGAVVVIDDDEVFCMVLSLALEAEGFGVATSTDGAAGVDIVRRTRPGCVILDLHLAAADGLAFLVKLRAMGKVGQLPVILLTALDDEEARDRSRAMGADLYLTKPVDMELLVWHVDELLARSTHDRVNPLAGLRQDPVVPTNLLL